MTVEVTSETGAPTPEPTRQTPLGSLKDRRKEIQDKLWIDLKVPRWTEPEVVVRYKPLDPTILAQSLEKRAETKTSEKTVWINCDILVQACAGVYGLIDDDTTKYSFRLNDWNGSWTKFDPDLAEALGLPRDTSRAVNVVRELYQTDGDIIACANQVLEFSGNMSEEVAKDF